MGIGYMVRAALQGAEIWCGVTALRVRRPHNRGDCWSVQLTHTDERLASREGRQFWVSAHRVIIASTRFIARVLLVISGALLIAPGTLLVIRALKMLAVPLIEPFYVIATYWLSRNHNRPNIVARLKGSGRVPAAGASCSATRARPTGSPAPGWRCSRA